MAQVFISYKREDRQLTEDLARNLEALGYSVWWDTRLVSGDDIDDVIVNAIDAAEAAIVIWTPNSVGSKWVRSEARRADRQRKLVPVRVPELDPNDVPLPFDGYHTVHVDHFPSIAKALQKLGVLPSGKVPIALTGAASPPRPMTETAVPSGTGSRAQPGIWGMAGRAWKSLFGQAGSLKLSSGRELDVLQLCMVLTDMIRAQVPPKERMDEELGGGGFGGDRPPMTSDDGRSYTGYDLMCNAYINMTFQPLQREYPHILPRRLFDAVGHPMSFEFTDMLEAATPVGERERIEILDFIRDSMPKTRGIIADTITAYNAEARTAIEKRRLEQR